MRLSWSYDAPTEAAGLRVYTGLDGAGVLLAELPVTETTYTDTVAEPELRYYRFEAVDGQGTVIDVSQEIAVQTFRSLNASLLG